MQSLIDLPFGSNKCRSNVSGFEVMMDKKDTASGRSKIHTFYTAGINIYVGCMKFSCLPCFGKICMCCMLSYDMHVHGQQNVNLNPSPVVVLLPWD